MQKYLSNPYLIDGLKFDVKIFALIYGVDPLRIFVFREGIASFASEQYQKPDKENLEMNGMHFTGLEESHQKTASSVFKHIEEYELELGKTQEEIWQEIDEIIVKTIIST